MIDANLWLNRGNQRASVRRLLEEQVQYADVLVVNKIDTVTADALEEIIETVRVSPGLFLFQHAFGEPVYSRCVMNRPYQPVLVLSGDELDHETIKKWLIANQIIVITEIKGALTKHKYEMWSLIIDEVLLTGI